MQLITHRRNAVNITGAERAASLGGGALLIAAGLRKRSGGGIALALLGGELVRRATTGHCYLFEALGIRTAPRGQGASVSVPYELGVRIDSAITIDAPRAAVYRVWRGCTNFPLFMRHVESVRATGRSRTHWVVRAPGRRIVEWDAEVHNEIPDELIAWRSLPGADVDNAGSVIFKDAPGGKTEVKIELQYDPPGGALGALIAKLLGSEPTQQIEEDLKRLKAILEAGEFRSALKGQQPSATPPAAEDWRVQEALEESFPASDAPAFNV
jgi:uncharacterized membrane protein